MIEVLNEMKCRIHNKPKNLDKVVKDEMMRQVKEWGEKYNIDMYATILWTLHDKFGFGKKRLKRFFENFMKNYDKFTIEYQFDDTYAEQVKLKEQCGVDVGEWMKEVGLLGETR